MRKIKKVNNLFFEEIEKEINENEKFVQEQIRKEKDIFDSYILLKEYKKVMQLSRDMIITNRSQSISGDPRSVNYGINAEGGNHGQQHQESLIENQNMILVSNVIGTIETNEKERFKKLIFRATRGNALAHFRDFDKPILDFYGNKIYKTVYVVIFPDGEAIKNKINII